MTIDYSTLNKKRIDWWNYSGGVLNFLHWMYCKLNSKFTIKL